MDLHAFSLEGPAGAVPPDDPPAGEGRGRRSKSWSRAACRHSSPSCARVSDEWLAERAGAEKGFSLGFFDEAVPGAVPDCRSQSAAARWWRSRTSGRVPAADEVSVDSDALHREAPKGVMEALLREPDAVGEGVRGYSGSCSAWRRSPGSSSLRRPRLWNRLGAFLYRHGESVYTSRGCGRTRRSSTRCGSRTTWCIPAASRLARILADVSALVAGGYRRIFL